MARIVCILLAVLLVGASGESTEVPSSSEVTTNAPTADPTTGAPPTAAPTSPPTAAPTSAPTTAAPTTEAPSTETPTTGPSTTPAPPTPSPTDEFFRVTEDNVTCIMYSGDVTLTVSYKQASSGQQATAKVSIPHPGDELDVKSAGSCNGTTQDNQFLTITWGPTNERSSFNLLFNSTGSKWMLVTTQANIYIDEKTFVNATDAGKFLNVVGSFPGLNDVAVDTNSSLTCRAAVSSTNFSAQVINSTAQYTVTGNAVGVKLQAFNSIPYTSQLQEGMRCEADITSDLVPIAVGCALAGLVLLVLISYLVGRRRRSAAYQSV